MNKGNIFFFRDFYINNDMDGKSYTDVAGIKSVIEDYGYKLFMTPAWGGMAESMQGQSPITAIKKFDHGLFQASDYLSLSNGFSNPLLNDYAWYGFCGFGFCIMVLYVSLMTI